MKYLDDQVDKTSKTSSICTENLLQSIKDTKKNEMMLNSVLYENEIIEIFKYI